MKSILFALHGFLGHISDWKGINNAQTSSDIFHPVNLYSNLKNWDLWDWAKDFNQCVKNSFPSFSHTLMGYSLGGRLALHALIIEPTLWSQAIIISTHPGLEIELEKTQRLLHDECWAKRFESESWDSLTHDWDSQEVFKPHLIKWQRNERDYSRQLLAATLREWSLGKQDNLRQSLSELQIPILWITGELDTKFTDIVKQLKLAHPESQKVIVPNSGHRVVWEHPEFFYHQLKQFLKKRENHGNDRMYNELVSC